MNAIIPMYVHTTNFVSDRVEAIKNRYEDRDRGANLVEYAGLIVLAAIILGLLYAAVQASGLQSKITGALNNIFTGKGQSGG